MDNLKTIQLNKIFQIGFNKCGTTSIYCLFKNFTNPKIPSIHWDSGNLAKAIQKNMENNIKLLTGYEEYICFCDMEYLGDNHFFSGRLFKQLDKQYPGSKFILNTRNINKWIDSRLNHKTYIERYMTCFSLNREESIKIWKEDWNSHYNTVVEYFNNRKEDLLIYDIEIDNIEKIKCFFSKIEFTINKFPHALKTKNISI